MRNATITFLCIAVLAGTPSFAAGASGHTIVVLPFDNFSGVQSAPEEIAKLIDAELAAKGWTQGDSSRVNEVIERQRVRYLDSIEPGVVAAIVDETKAEAIVSGTIYTFSGSRNPIVAISARMIRADGSLGWSDLAGLSADDTEQILGFGRKTTVGAVAASAAKELMRRFPRAGEDSTTPVRGPSKSLLQTAPASFRSRELDGRPQRVCVLPFDNFSPSPEAGRIVTDIVSLRLAADKGFDIVEPATLRAAALKARIGSFRGIGSDDLVKLSAAVGTPLFIRGTVYSFVDPTARGGAGDPEVQIELSLVDVSAGSVLWAAQHGRRGSDYIGFLMLGNVSNTVALADRVISEIVDAGAHVARRGEAAAKNARATKKRTGETHSEIRNRTKIQEK